jgi:hypothetical protein
MIGTIILTMFVSYILFNLGVNIYVDLFTKKDKE